MSRKFRLLTRDDVTVSHRTEPELLPVYGFAEVSNLAQSAEDIKELERSIQARVNKGEHLAWFSLIVYVSWKNYKGMAMKSCLSLPSESNTEGELSCLVLEHGLILEALDDLNSTLEAIYNDLSELEIVE